MFELFAQINRGGGANAAQQGGALAGLGFFICFYGVILLIALGIQAMFLLTMSKCLKQIAPRNRQMEPGSVWLCLIPLFGIVWTIIMILRVAYSLRDEYDDRRLRGDGDFGKTLGIVYIVSAFICGIVALVCFIMYWVKIAGYTRELVESRDDDRPRRRRRDEDDADDVNDDQDDDRPRRRRRRDEDDDR
jgi:hypothetical protein